MSPSKGPSTTSNDDAWSGGAVPLPLTFPKVEQVLCAAAARVARPRTTTGEAVPASIRLTGHGHDAMFVAPHRALHLRRAEFAVF